MPQATLAQTIKAKYPGVYDDIPDAELEQRVLQKYPGEYDDFPMTQAVGVMVNGQPQSFEDYNADPAMQTAGPSPSQRFRQGFVRGATTVLDPRTYLNAAMEKRRLADLSLEDEHATRLAQEAARPSPREFAAYAKSPEGAGELIGGVITGAALGRLAPQLGARLQQVKRSGVNAAKTATAVAKTVDLGEMPIIGTTVKGAREVQKAVEAIRAARAPAATPPPVATAPPSAPAAPAPVAAPPRAMPPTPAPEPPFDAMGTRLDALHHDRALGLKSDAAIAAMQARRKRPPQQAAAPPAATPAPTSKQAIQARVKGPKTTAATTPAAEIATLDDLKLSPAEQIQGVKWMDQGVPPEEILLRILQSRELTKRTGSLTPEQAATRIRRRNETGKWD